MQRSDQPKLAAVLSQLMATGDGALTCEQKNALLTDLHSRSPEMAAQVTTELLSRCVSMDRGLRQARSAVEELRQKMEELLGKTWYPALFAGYVGEPSDRSALVFHGNTRRVVGVWEQVPVESLGKGCEVLLNHDMSAIVACVPRATRAAGQIVTVVDRTTRGTLIIRSQEQEYEVEMAASLAGRQINVGDRVRWDPSACIVLDVIEQEQATRFLLGDVPDIPLEAVGGQDLNLRRLVDVLSAVLIDPQKAAEYGLSGRSSILLVGPPGCGKTLMVKAAVSHIAKTSGRQARFYVLKPAALESSLVGQSEANIREFFSAVRAAHTKGSLAVIFMDEVDCIGRVRGSFQGHYSDKSLNAFLAEIDGFAGREGIALIATTNRKDLIDSALLQRLSDHELQVGPPDMRGARQIFSIHLRPTLPYSPNGVAASNTRQETIAAAVEKIYSPNSLYAELVRLKFRDGKTRTIGARDFACGRLFQQICGTAQLAAYHRDLRGGGRGLRVSDMEDAVADAMQRLASNVTIHNVRNQLPDIPTDVDVVAVEPVLRKVQRAHRHFAESFAA